MGKMGCFSSKQQQQMVLVPVAHGQPQTLLNQPEEPKAEEIVAGD